jgi:hypothetical protein
MDSPICWLAEPEKTGKEMTEQIRCHANRVARGNRGPEKELIWSLGRVVGADDRFRGVAESQP